MHLNKEKEAGRSWPSRATRDQARECIKAAKELLHNINLAHTVAPTVETVDDHPRVEIIANAAFQQRHIQRAAEETAKEVRFLNDKKVQKCKFSNNWVEKST